MLITYHRAGRLSLLPALAIGAAAVVVVGVAATTLAIVGVAAGGIGLLRAMTRKAPAGPRAHGPDSSAIEGIVLESTDASRPARQGRRVSA